MFVFLLLARESAEEKGDRWKGMDLCRDRWKDGKKGFHRVFFINIPLSLQLVSLS